MPPDPCGFICSVRYLWATQLTNGHMPLQLRQGAAFLRRAQRQRDGRESQIKYLNVSHWVIHDIQRCWSCTTCTSLSHLSHSALVQSFCFPNIPHPPAMGYEVFHWVTAEWCNDASRKAVWVWTTCSPSDAKRILGRRRKGSSLQLLPPAQQGWELFSDTGQAGQVIDRKSLLQCSSQRRISPVFFPSLAHRSYSFAFFAMHVALCFSL